MDTDLPTLPCFFVFVEPRHDMPRLLFGAGSLSRSASSGSNVLAVEEFKLPKIASLVIVIAFNVLQQLSFFILISSSSKYTEYLGGNATFSGIAIGIPALFSGIALVPMTKYDKGRYATAFQIGCFAGILGNIAYAIAYHANYLSLILIGQCLSGVSFSCSMYYKRYCTDPLIVGIRRRTTLSSWLVIGQALGMTLGPFLGGLLYNIGFRSTIFNGYTSPGWIMAFFYLVFWLVIVRYFEDVATTERGLEPHPITALAHSVEGENEFGDSMSLPSVQTRYPIPPSEELHTTHRFSVTHRQWGVIFCMCWSSMVCFFILVSWEANLPIFGAGIPTLSWSPFAAGNFIALGGVAAFPFLLANMLFARHIQDRHLLALGSSLGLCGLLVFIGLLATGSVVYGTLFLCWWPVALGFNLATTVTLSLLSKQLPSDWNRRASMAIQYSNYFGRITGAIWGGSGVAVGMGNFVGLEIAFVGIGGVLFTTLWRNLKAKIG